MNKMLQSFAKTRLFLAALLAALCLSALAVPASGEVAIQEVKSDKGVTAWLVEDYSVPIVSINFAFEGGSTQDPAGKEGLAELMTGLFDEGAGELDSDAFQTKLDDAGAEMRFNAGRDAVSGSMRMLAEHKDEAFDLLRLAIVSPRFDAAPIDRIRAQIVSGIVANQRDPETEAAHQMDRSALWRSSLCPSGRGHRKIARSRSPQTTFTPITRPISRVRTCMSRSLAPSMRKR